MDAACSLGDGDKTEVNAPWSWVCWMRSGVCLDKCIVTTLSPEHFACLWVLTYASYFELLSLRLQLPSFADDC